MSKKVVIVDCERSAIPERSIIVDWQKCTICQKDTPEKLQCPATFQRKGYDCDSTYEALAANILRFAELGCMPVDLDLSALNCGNGIKETFKQREAKFHKSCKEKFNDLKLGRALKRNEKSGCPEEDSSILPAKIMRSSFSVTVKKTQEKCLFCEKSEGSLHRASSFRLDRRVRKCALILEDAMLLGKLSAGDMIAMDAMYHAKCLAALYNKVNRKQFGDDFDNTEKQLHGIALAELVAFIEEAYLDSENEIPLFKLADLVKMYASRLQQLGVTINRRVHSTELKNRILASIDDLTSYRKGRDVFLVFNSDIGSALVNACDIDYDDEAAILAKAATIVRRDMLNENKPEFDGKFDEKCQQEYVPQSLKTLVAMTLGGVNINSQSANQSIAQAVLSLSQLIMFNSTIRRRKSSTSSYHSKQREPPLPIYIGCLIHAKTRKRGLVNKFHELGMSVSYDRVLRLSTDMGNSLCALYEEENVVCPPSLRHGLFTTAAVDNIDHNPSATSALGSFHGTGISLFQHIVQNDEGTERCIPVIQKEVAGKQKLSKLPDFYSEVPPVSAFERDLNITDTAANVPTGDSSPSAFKEDQK